MNGEQHMLEQIERLRFERDAARAELHETYAKIEWLRAALRRIAEQDDDEFPHHIARTALEVKP